MGCGFDPNKGEAITTDKRQTRTAKVIDAGSITFPKGTSVEGLLTLLALISGANPAKLGAIEAFAENSDGTDDAYDFDGHGDKRFVHIPDGKHAEVAAKVHAATKRAIREAAGVAQDDPRPICPGCVQTVTEDVSDLNTDEFKKSGKRARSPGSQIARMIREHVGA